MPTNDLAPGFVKLFYSSNSNAHVATLPCTFDPSTPTPGFDPTLTQKGGGTIAASLAIQDYIFVAKAYFPAAASFTRWEAYSKAVGVDPTFLYGDDLTTVGTGAGSATANGQVVFTFRTGAGGVLRLYLMEPISVPNTRAALRTTSAAPAGAFATYILGSTNWIIGRDGAFPIAGLFATTKTNDALRKRTLLDN